MANIKSAIQDTIPITQFNRGLAGKIFDEVKRTGAKVVMKNNVAACVLLAPEEYLRMMEELEDARLISLAADRLSRFDPSLLISEKEMDELFGIEESDLENFDEVDFE